MNHGHFTVNGKRVNIPSFLVKVGDLVAVCEASVSKPRFKKMKEDDAFVAAPKWLDRDKNTLQGKVVAIPTKGRHRLRDRRAPDRRVVLQVMICPR